MALLHDFVAFLRKQNVISVALGLATGLAVNSLTNSLITDIITPLYAPYVDILNPNLSITIGLSNFGIGHFFQMLVNFLVILFIVFVIGELMTRKQGTASKGPTKK